MKYLRPIYPTATEKDDVVNHLRYKYKKAHIVPKPRNQVGPTCQFSAMSGGADMGFKKSKAHMGPSDIHFKETELVEVSSERLGITKEFPPCDVLDIFERFGNAATCSDWEGSQTRTIMGSSCGKPSIREITDLILKGVPLLATFDCCDYIEDLKKDEVYQSLPTKSDEEDKENGVVSHMVLIFGYGCIREIRLVFLHFQNSWDVDFCDEGARKIDFTSIKEFHTIEMFSHPERNVIAQGEKTVTLKCYGLTRKVEISVVKACDYIFQRRHDTVVLPEQVSPLALSLILGYLRLVLEPSEDLSGLKEDFVKRLDVEMMYEVMIAADAIRLRNLSVACASAFIDSTAGWEDEQIDENMPAFYKKDWTDIQDVATKISKLRKRPRRAA